ncbi:hypothetical protein Tco_0121849, partial [Tanacetum coccineum]
LMYLGDEDDGAIKSCGFLEGEGEKANGIHIRQKEALTFEMIIVNAYMPLSKVLSNLSVFGDIRRQPLLEISLPAFSVGSGDVLMYLGDEDDGAIKSCGFLEGEGEKANVGMKGLDVCKASASNLKRIQVKDIVKEVKDYLKTYLSAGMDISWYVEGIR